ncbi:MAG TPA: FHA domain-containing protein [Kofleriaceae bacterium]|nr:FHA domain-containing protein [Kofleriaceae bacterium]
MGARVLFRDSHGRDGQVDLSPAAPLYVGRALDCAVRTDDAMVSRKHSMIRMENGRFYVEDLGSSNGTHVNDVRITKHPLSHNDVVRCGSLWLRYVEDGPLPVQVAPAGPPDRPKGGTQRLEPAEIGLAPGSYPSHGRPEGGGSSTAQGQGAGRHPAYGGPAPGPGPSAGPKEHWPAQGAGGPAAGAGAGHFPGGGRPMAGGPMAGPMGGPMGGPMAGGPAGGPMPGGPAGGHVGGNPVGGGGPAGAGYPAAGPMGQGQAGYPARPGGQGARPGRGRHGDAGAAGVGYDLFGGPPAMPGDGGIIGGDLITPPRSSGPPIGDEDSIVVDMADGEARLRKELDEALSTVEKLQIAYDREVADGKRLRAEIVTHKDRTDELRRALAERDEVVEAHNRVADELREELRQAKDGLAGARTQQAELADLVAARERQLARGQDDIGQLKQAIQDKERQLSELSRTKDEGWRKLNEQLTEIEHLREVITQQERLLEERRVGLISQEEMIKELRADREQHLRDAAHLKAEREELTSKVGRLSAQVAAIDEENRRLTQLLTELRGRRGPGGEEDHAAAAHAAATTAELKTLRIALKTVESDRDHYKELGERAEGEVDELRERVAKLEVELRDASDDRERAQAGKSVADDAVTRAELSRHKAAEEAVTAARARDEAERLQHELQRELDKARRRVVELEEDTASQTGLPHEAVVEENRRLERKVAEAADIIAELEQEVRTARAETHAAVKRSTAMRSAVLPVASAGEEHEPTAVVTQSRNPAALVDRAIEVHDGINDVLSELRNNAMILHDEFAKGPAERSPESSRIMREAIEALLGQAEEAKGVLRRLRELVEFGND